jgi:hypothetical protein
MTISNASVCRISVSCFVPIPTTITFGAGDEERWLRVDSRRVREDSSSLDRRHSRAGLGVGCQSGSCHQAQANKKDRLIRERGDPPLPMSQSLRGLLAYRTGRAALPAPAWAAASAAGAGVRELAGQREVDIAAVAVEHNLPLHEQLSLDHQRGAHLGSDRVDRPHRAQLGPAGTDRRGSARRAPACPRARDFYRRRRWKPACKQSGGPPVRRQRPRGYRD